MSIILDGDTGVSTLQNHEQITVDSSGNVTLSPGSILYTPRADGTRSGEFYTDNSGTWLKSSISGNDPVYIDTTGGALRVQNNGLDTLTVDNNGRVTMPYQPSWSLAPTSSGTYSGSYDPIPFGVAGNNIPHAVGVSISNGQVTVPVSGRYFISGMWRQEGQQTDMQIVIRVNGTQIARAGIWYSSQQYESIHISRVLNLQANDYVQIGISSPSSTWAGYGDHLTFFEGFLIG